MQNFKTILIMIDNQVGFNTTQDTKTVGKRIVDLSNLGVFDYQIATKYVNNLKLSTNLFTRLQNWNYLTKESEIAYVDNLKYDHSVTKYVYTAVNSELLKKLREINNNQLPQLVFLVGLDTECCVLKTAVDFFEIGVIPVLLEFYTHSNSGIEAKNRGIALYSRLIDKSAIITNEIKTKDDVNQIYKQFLKYFII
ncbi:MAG: isochorismatase family protein [Malacoplasma sp.]|nr:isochorismatase family protein [Malacoplasma sp.]